MSDDAAKVPFVLNETMLANLGVSESGWIGDRAVISETTMLAIRKLLEGTISNTQLRSFLADLDRGFANAVEMAFFMIALHREVEAHAVRTEWRRPLPRKLGVLLRDYISNLRLVLEKAKRGERKVTLSQFIGDIERFPVLKRLVTLELEERFRLEIIDPLRNAPEKSAKLLPNVLKDLEASIAAGVKRGSTAAPLTYLAGLIVHAYQNTTGDIPGRTWDDFTKLETGNGLEICRLLARELYDILPVGSFPDGPADMAKPYRKAIEHVRREERKNN